jgi:hypothetical protein
MASEAYLEKLRDPRWQKLRLKIMERDHWACCACGAKDKTLHVHHWRYSGEPWESPPEDLSTLCETCHVREGRDRPAIEAALIQTLRDANWCCNDLLLLRGMLLKLRSRYPSVLSGLNGLLATYLRCFLHPKFWPIARAFYRRHSGEIEGPSVGA